MSEEITLIKRELQEELNGAQEKLLKRYEQAIKGKLVAAQEVGQTAAESLIGGLVGWASSKAVAGTVIWLKTKKFPVVGSRVANFWAGLTNIGLGGGTFLVNSAMKSGPVPSGLRQGIRTGSSVSFFLGLNEALDATVDYLAIRAQKRQAELEERIRQGQLPQPAAKK
jgi:hypothetical protein